MQHNQCLLDGGDLMARKMKRRMGKKMGKGRMKAASRKMKMEREAAAR
jgi:hypothetical protein